MHTRIADKLDAQHLACPVLHEFQRDLGRELIFHSDTSASIVARFGMQRGPFQRWSIMLRPQKAPRFTKVAALTKSQKSRNPRFTRAKEKYEN